MKKLFKLFAGLLLLSSPILAADKTVNLYTTLSGAGIDRAGDWIPIWDTDAAGMKKVTTNSLFTGYVIGTNIEAWDADLDYLASFTPAANVKSILNAADYSAIRTLLGLVIGTNVQAYDADLTTYAGITPSADVQTLLGTASFAAFRAALGVAIGTNVQAYDADLTTYASITPSANVQSLLGAADYAAMKTLLSLTIGTDVQAYNARLADISGLGVTDNAVVIGNGSNLVLESGATLKTSLGLTIGTNIQAWDADLDVIAALGDANADRIVFWDDSAGSFAYLQAGSGLTISGTTISSSAGTRTTSVWDGSSALTANTDYTYSISGTKTIVLPSGVNGEYNSMKFTVSGGPIVLTLPANTYRVGTNAAASSITLQNGYHLVKFFYDTQWNVVDNVIDAEAAWTLYGNWTSGSAVPTFTQPTSSLLASAITDETGSGSIVFGTSPTITNANLVTPTLGVASATTINKVTITAPATSSTLTIADGKTLTASQTTTLDRQSSTGLPVEFCVAASDETTAITTGTGKVTFRAPYAFTVTEIRASVNTAPSGSTILIDINESGTTIISTKLMIDAGEKTSTTATTAYVLSDTSIADDAELSVDFDQVGSSTAGTGVKVWIKGYR